MLSPYRVLDLTTERGLLCGQILGDLGADVIKVEPPGGSSARRLGPFYRDEPHPDRSLLWWAYNRNKRGITLDIETPEGRATLLRLVETAHFFIESDNPGRLAELGLGYDQLGKMNPALVYVSITPFGQDGPKASYADSDLSIMAAAGPLALTGDDDRPPVRISVPQAYAHASAEAAVAALVAHHERQRSGRGQHVDVSAQQSVAMATQSGILSQAWGDDTFQRVAGGVKAGPLTLRLAWPAKDGHVAITYLFGSAIGPFTRRLMEWIHEEGFCDEATRDKDWIAYSQLLLTGQEPVSEFERLKLVVEEFVKTKTKGELLRAALERGLLIAPMTKLDEVVDSEQLASRGYWQLLEHEELGEAFRYPGPFAKFSESPIVYRRRSPLIGQHNEEVLRELVNTGGVASVSPAVDGNTGDGPPLADVKIVDLMWAMAGPASTRILADCGAQVVRIESTHRIEVARTLWPFKDRQPGPETSGCFQNLNAGKLGMTLDLTKEAGREVCRDLVRWADVVTESFSPKAMPAWGLDYESLRGIKPDIIMLSTCLMGQSGPLTRFAGFGNLAAAISGFANITGWPDRPPAGPFGAYTDYVAPKFAAAAVLAALEHRRRTGMGQHIDLSQAEAALHFLGPALLDYTANGRVQERVGNRDREMAPHGVYPCAGDDRWVAIAVAGDDQWRALCEAMGRPQLAADARYAGAAERLARADELDAIVSEWTQVREPHDVEEALQACDVAASAVQNSRELYCDLQLAFRGHFVDLPHDVVGTATVEGSRFRLSRTPARVERSGPTLGRDNEHVLKEILGYDEERIVDLITAGALE